MRANAEMATGVMHDSDPPVITTSETAVADEARRLADRVRARGTGGGDAEVRAGPAELHRDRARGCVGHHHRDEERADAARALLDVDRDLLLERDQAADAGAEDHRTPRRVGVRVAGVGERVGRGRDTELRHPVDAPRFLRRRGTAVGSKSRTSHPIRTGSGDGSYRADRARSRAAAEQARPERVEHRCRPGSSPPGR